MARLRARSGASEHRIVVVEDDADLLATTLSLLEREGHQVRGAATPMAGLDLIREWQPHLVLLDYYMPGGTGADVVRALRSFNTLTQVLLVTGYAAEQPARKLLAELDIQGYHDKADGPQRLLVLVDAALKHAAVLTRMVRHRAYLQHILDVSPQIARLQPPRELLHAAVSNVGALLSGGDGFVATVNNGLFVLDQALEGISIHAGTGHYADAAHFSALPTEMAEVVRFGLQQARPGVHASGHVVIPLKTRTGERGCMVVEAAALPADAVEPCEIYANLVVQALENVLLYQRATVDPLTEIYNRGFGFQRLQETLRLATRRADPTSVVMIDLDRFKALNDSHGHTAGDLVLRSVARVVKDTCRTTDVVARYGGEELFVVLPSTDLNGARRISERLREAIRNLAIPFENKVLKVTASLGVASIDDGAVDAATLVKCADIALYEAKAAGRDAVRAFDPALAPALAGGGDVARLA